MCFCVIPVADEPAVGSPTSVTYFSSRPDPSNASQCLVGTNTGWLALIDVETGKLVNKAPPPTSSASNETAGGSADSDTSPLQDTTPFEQTVDKDLSKPTNSIRVSRRVLEPSTPLWFVLHCGGFTFDTLVVQMP